MVTLTKLNDVFENWATGDGIFTDLNTLNPPWKVDDVTENTKTISNLNMAYHGSHSGDKNVSPIVHKFLSSDDVNTRSKLANIIFTMYADKWTKLWDALEIEYNPLNNYDMTENETIDEMIDDTTTKTGTDAVSMTGTDTNTKTGTETLGMTGTDATATTGTETTTKTGTDNIAHTGNTENEVSAFNSSSYQDSSKDTINTADNETRNMTDTTTHNTTDTETRNMTDTTTYNSTVDEDISKSNMRALTRSGNIGVTTSQQMLQSEIELRKWLYYQSVFNDIDDILTLSIY